MRLTLDTQWCNETKEKLDHDVELKFEQVLTDLPHKRWLIAELTRRNVPFKVYNMGAGVVKIVTNTDTCPCCKKKLK